MLFLFLTVYWWYFPCHFIKKWTIHHSLVIMIFYCPSKREDCVLIGCCWFFSSLFFVCFFNKLFLWKFDQNNKDLVRNVMTELQICRLEMKCKNWKQIWIMLRIPPPYIFFLFLQWQVGSTIFASVWQR